MLHLPNDYASEMRAIMAHERILPPDYGMRYQSSNRYRKNQVLKKSQRGRINDMRNTKHR